MKKLTQKIVSAALLALPMLGFAQAPSSPRVTTITSVQDIFDIIQTIINWLAATFFAVAVIFIFYAAYLYLTAAGDPEKLTKAKNQLIYSIVAIAIGLIAFSVTTIVSNFIR